jgi:magnesium transporter
MTVTVRAIANKDINQANMLKVIVKEILVCSFNGLALAMIGFLVCMLMFPTLGLGSVFATSIILSFTVAGFLGAVIPISLHKLNIDPATASGVFLTTLTDILGFITFLSLAHIFLI